MQSGTMTCMRKLECIALQQHMSKRCETYYISCISYRILVTELLIDRSSSCTALTVPRCSKLVEFEVRKAWHWRDFEALLNVA